VPIVLLIIFIHLFVIKEAYLSGSLVVKLGKASESTCRAVEIQAMTMLPALESAPENVAEMRPALDRFTRLIIPDLTPVCVAVQQLLHAR